MTIEEVISCLNKSIEDRRRAKKISTRGHLVLQKTIEKTIVNAYRQIKYVLWFVKGKEKYKILDLQNTCRILNNNVESAVADMEKYFMINLFSFIYNSSSFEKIVKGEYKGYDVLMSVEYGKNAIQ